MGKNNITGYKIKKFQLTDVIPIDAIFMMKESGNIYICGSYYPYEYYVYQVPIYGVNKVQKQSFSK